MILKAGIAHALLDGGDFFCRHCGKRESAGFPMAIGGKRMKALVLNGEAFAEEHERCVETHESPTRRAFRDPRVWPTGGDAGISSSTIWHVAMGGAIPWSNWYAGIPHDPDDFGRCYRLLKAFPEMRASLPRVAELFPSWVPFVREWDRLTEMFERESPSGQCPELYALMQQLRGGT